MGAIISEFLSALPAAAASPLAFVGYIVVIVAWIVTSVLSGKTKRLFKSLDKLSESERLEAIKLEYRTVPKDGVTAKDWLQAKQANYRYVRLGAIVIVLLAILGLSAYLANQAMQAQRAAASTLELINILDQREQAILNELQARGDTQSKTAADEFKRLHEKNVEALTKGNQVESHEIMNLIKKLLNSLPDPPHIDYVITTR